MRPAVLLFVYSLEYKKNYAAKVLINQETFISNYSEIPTDLNSTYEEFQLALINILQQAFKELFV
jgi:hypothetical protein